MQLSNESSYLLKHVLTKKEDNFYVLIKRTNPGQLNWQSLNEDMYLVLLIKEKGRRCQERKI